MKITYSKGRTINMGNFNSTRVDIGIEIEYSDSLGDKDEKLERAKEWVNKKLSTEKGE